MAAVRSLKDDAQAIFSNGARLTYDEKQDAKMMQRKITRCAWVDVKDDDYVAYHDHEWGQPVHDDRLLFEMLVLEMFVAGLSWQCVLHKRAAFKKAFDNFDVAKVAAYGDDKIATLAQNPDIIRHVGKIKAAILNAQIVLKLQKEYTSLDCYLWHFTHGKTVLSDGFETRSALSDCISQDLKKRGAKFTGSVMVFSYLAAIGIISAHQEQCEWR